MTEGKGGLLTLIIGTLHPGSVRRRRHFCLQRQFDLDIRRQPGRRHRPGRRLRQRHHCPRTHDCSDRRLLAIRFTARAGAACQQWAERRWRRPTACYPRPAPLSRPARPDAGQPVWTAHRQGHFDDMPAPAQDGRLGSQEADNPHVASRSRYRHLLRRHQCEQSFYFCPSPYSPLCNSTRSASCWQNATHGHLSQFETAVKVRIGPHRRSAINRRPLYLEKYSPLSH